jgi:CPA1 family monovalent cation:H+ antiporter
VQATFVLTLAARAIIVYGFDLVLRPVRQRVPASWNVLLWSGGWRATVPLALTLALPRDIAYHALVPALEYGRVPGSLLIEGLSVAPLAKRLGVLQREPIGDGHPNDEGEEAPAESF